MLLIVLESKSPNQAALLVWVLARANSEWLQGRAHVGAKGHMATWQASGEAHSYNSPSWEFRRPTRATWVSSEANSSKDLRTAHWAPPFNRSNTCQHHHFREEACNTNPWTLEGHTQTISKPSNIYACVCVYIDIYVYVYMCEYVNT
jgi:hypothetical protein